MSKSGITLERELSTLGLVVVVSFLLSACGAFPSPMPEPKVVGTEGKTVPDGQLFGTAVRHVLGPADELVEVLPLEKPILLLIPIVDSTPGGDETITINTEPALIIAKLKDNSSVLQLMTDQQGEFSATPGFGEYLFCVSYSALSAPTFHYYQCRTLSISNSEPSNISIVFSPMVGLHILPIE